MGALLAWGPVQLSLHASHVARYFGADMEIWMTEWGYASWSGVPLAQEPGFEKTAMQASAMTGLFHSSFLLGMVERATLPPAERLAPHTAAHHHILNEQEGVPWGKGAGLVKLPAGSNMENLNATLVNSAGQIFSHLVLTFMKHPI